MSIVGYDAQLSSAIKQGNLHAVKAALEAGARVNGLSKEPFSPVVAATIGERVDIIDFLLMQGADPNRPVTTELACTGSECVNSGIHNFGLGERALHIVARTGRLEITRLLLERSRANPNATDSRGCTPLMATCESHDVHVEMVRLLLEAGADPALAEENGFIPLHAVARRGLIDLVDMLYTAAPATLNRCAYKAETPLFFACLDGNEAVVSKLLSLGAMQRVPLDCPNVSPLTTAVIHGYVGVVRILVNEGGVRAVGGEMALANALYKAVQARQARIIPLLLAAEGEEGRSEWANTYLQGMHLLHFGAGYCYPAAVSILLKAGADESARDSKRRIPREVIGVKLDRQDKVKRRGEKEVAIRRMLQRGPAYRARSWAWPSDEEADAGGSGDGGAVAAVLSSPPAVKTPPSVGVRIFRPKEKSSTKLFVRLIGRYCEKD